MHLTFCTTQPMAPLLKRRWLGCGYSMSELVIVISIMGVISTIGVSGMRHFLDGAKIATAQERQERLNQAVRNFNASNYELTFTPNPGSTVDERTMLLSLQYRNPDAPAFGAPYFDPRYQPKESSDSKEYRLRWAGQLFELLKPGTSGTGFLIDFQGRDFTTPVSFPPNFKPGGR